MKAALLSIAISSLVLGCSAEPPDPNIPTAPDSGVDEEAPPPEEVVLTLDDVVGQTDYQTVMVSGTGPANGIVVYHAPARGNFTEDILPTGVFCIDIPLLEGKDNDLSFYAISIEGEESKQAFVTVTQSGEEPEPGPEQEAGLRLVKGISHLAAENFVDDPPTAFGALYDGVVSQTVTLEEDYVGMPWFTFSLPSATSVNEIRVVSDADKPLETYDIYASSTSGDPGPVHWNSPNWTKIATIRGETTGDEDITPEIIAEAKHIGFILQGGYSLNLDMHYIKEIQVLTDDASDGGGSNPAQGPSCAGGSF
jgi:hypothetical protein